MENCEQIMLEVKAEIIYERGWKLVLPADGNGPRLFFEWVAEKQKEDTRPVRIRVETDTTGKDGDITPILIIRPTKVIVEELKELRDYINLNL